ncbi:MAG TPA: AmmeMemoRadiSam system radical SAM enzyme [Bacillota bacterium]|nr:AmmeMemoRadiSam system radical SAM enzyme [Bacillota bacterium]
MSQEAKYYRKLDQGRVQCELCPHRCTLTEGGRGICRARGCTEGKLHSLNYGQVSSFGLDPIEKKPLYHFYPGWDIVSLGTVGCNLGCSFCQNWSIAHGDPETTEMTAEQAVTLALAQGGERNLGIAYTYSEPLVWYEFVLDCARLVKDHGLKNVLVTNGFINLEPLQELLPYLDALNIDVKGFTPEYYTEICRGSLEGVKAAVELAAKHCHVEVTTLLVTDLNDSPQEVEELADWLAGINRDIPLHLTRYFPNYKLDKPATPLDRMEQAFHIARDKLNYVYLGNMDSEEGRDTYCRNCGTLLVSRRFYRGKARGLAACGDYSCCRICGQQVPIKIQG